MDSFLRAAGKGPKPSFRWYDLATEVYMERPLRDLEPFFRPVVGNDPFDPPRPNTAEFWQIYSEPLEDFAFWCEHFSVQ
jgi:hypothetical protein